MDVQLANNAQFSDKSLEVKNNTLKKDEIKKQAAQKEVKAGTKADTYEHVQTGKKVIYGKPEVKADAKTIQQLQEEIDRAHEHLKQLVMALFQRQGLKYQDLGDIKIEDLKNIKIDNTARKEAEAMIADGGEFSAENVSNRIVDFAKAVSGGDKSKVDQLKAAITSAYDEVKQKLNDDMPELTEKTYHMMMDKLDAWAKADEPDKKIEKSGKTEASGRYIKVEIVETTVTIESIGKPEKML